MADAVADASHAPGQILGFGDQFAVAAGQRQRVVTLADRADRRETVTGRAKRDAMRGAQSNTTIGRSIKIK